MVIKELGNIKKNQLIKPEIFEMIIELPLISKVAKAGQFLNISLDNDALLLRRPISISSIDNDLITICYRIQGEGTKLLSDKKVNMKIDILGPLGNGFSLVNEKKVLLIGGGIGVPPLVELAKKLSINNQVISLLAFRDKESIIYDDELKKYGQVFLATDDGSVGFHGNALQFLNTEKLNFDIFYACGPVILLKLLDEKYLNIKEGYLSFEERMACGIGACYGCVCKTKTIDNGYLRVCKEGPVFKLGEIKYES